MKRFTALLLFSLCVIPWATSAAGFYPMSWWKAEGNALDSAGANHGVLVGGTAFAPGIDGQAFSVDGADDEIRITPEPLDYRFSNSVSVAGWLVTTGANAFAGLIDHFTEGAQTTGFQVSMSGNNGFPPNRAGILRADLGVGTTYATVYNQRRVDDGLPHHFALTYDGEQAILYVDGVAGTPVVITNWVPPTTEQILIGADSAASARHFKGLLDEIAIFNWPLAKEAGGAPRKILAIGPKNVRPIDDLDLSRQLDELRRPSLDERGEVDQGKNGRTRRPDESRSHITSVNPERGRPETQKFAGF
jgi:hypothetical protein